MRVSFNGLEEAAGIYQIINVQNNKAYIGSTKRFIKRYKEHKSMLKHNKHNNKHLQNAFNESGPESFIFIPLQVIEGDKKKRTIIEKMWLDSIEPEFLYNIEKNPVAPERTIFSRNPEETKKKISEALKKFYEENGTDSIPRDFSEETKSKRREALKAWYQVPENKEKFIAICKERYAKNKEREEEKLKKGRVYTEEKRKEISERKKLFWANNREKMLKIHRSDEHRKKMSEIATKTHQNKSKKDNI
jgi:group I intron endonuclease